MKLRDLYQHIATTRPADLDGEIHELALLTPTQRHIEYYQNDDGIQRADITEEVQASPSS